MEKSPRWRVFAQFSANNYLMCGIIDGVVRYAPLCIHIFRLIAPRKLLEAQLFNQQYHAYEEIDNIPDRLRWCRHHMGLTQKEVADLVGMSRSCYIILEANSMDYFDGELVDKLAALYQISPEDLLDEYNTFLYHGQGKQIKDYRESHGLSRREFARQLNVSNSCVRGWETETKHMHKKSWEKYFRHILK